MSNFRETAMSTVARPGPRKIFLPALPNVYCFGTAKAAVLNHFCAEGSEIDGFPTTFGRSDPNVPPVLPVLLLSVRRIGVKGWPDCAAMIPDVCRLRSTRL